MRDFRKTIAVLSATILSACQGAVIDRPTLSAADLKAEGLRQEVSREQAWIDVNARLNDISYPILRGGTALCGPDWTMLSDGIGFASLANYDKSKHDVMTDGFGMNFRPQAIFVVKGSPAEQAGVLVGDKFLIYRGVEVSDQENAFDIVHVELRNREKTTQRTFPYRIKRGDDIIDLEIDLVPVCSYPVYVEESTETNAYANGKEIIFTRSMMRLMDDYSLAVIAGHELAHNVMSHNEKSAANAAPAMAAGFAVDLLAALAGVNTQGAFMKMAGNAAHAHFSVDFESEADTVGMYLLAMGGYPVEGAENVWRKMAAEVGTSIYQDTSHPPSAERYLNLAHLSKEISAKIEAGDSLRPPLPEDWEPKKAASDTEGQAQLVEDTNEKR